VRDLVSRKGTTTGRGSFHDLRKAWGASITILEAACLVVGKWLIGQTAICNLAGASFKRGR
jgi:hypothetical protein